MKQFLLRVFIFAALIAGGLVFSLFALNDPRGRGLILATTPMRHALLAATPSPKIVLVGGSGVGSGIDSARISEALGRPVVNMGVNAGMSLLFMLNEVRGELGAGDTVVLIPEYKILLRHQNFRGGYALVRVLFEFDPAARKYMTPRMWFDLTPAILSHAFENSLHIRRLLPKTAGQRERERVWLERRFRETPYSTNYINQAGDAYGHWDLQPLPTIKADVYDWPDPGLTPAAKNALLEFRDDMAGRGVRVVFLPPAVQEASIRASQAAIDALVRDLAACGMPYDAPPERYMLRDDWFYDSPYHPLRPGVEFRTGRMIEDIRRVESAE